MPNFRSTEEAFSMSRPRLKRGEGIGLKQGSSAAARLLKNVKAQAQKAEPKKGAKKK